MNDVTAIYLIFLLSVFCACVVLIAVSCFWDCFKNEIVQVRFEKHNKANRADSNDENEPEKVVSE